MRTTSKQRSFRVMFQNIFFLIRLLEQVELFEKNGRFRFPCEPKEHKNLMAKEQHTKSSFRLLHLIIRTFGKMQVFGVGGGGGRVGRFFSYKMSFNDSYRTQKTKARRTYIFLAKEHNSETFHSKRTTLFFGMHQKEHCFSIEKNGGGQNSLLATIYLKKNL